MALALLRWTGDDNDGSQIFEVDIGSNRYYAWAVGSGSSTRQGVPVVTARTHGSPLIGPLEPGRRGKTLLRVPGDAFDADHHHLQLLSFRDDELRGPAASDVVEVPWRWTPPSQRGGAVMAASLHTSPGHRIAIEQRLSHAQFLDALMGMVSKILPTVNNALPTINKLIPAISGLVGGQAPATPPNSTAPPAPGVTLPAGAKPNLGELLAELLKQLTATAPTAGTSGTKSLAGGQPAPRYSYGSWVQLLAALPALSGVLEKVLTPETVQAVVGAADPNKMMKTVFDGLTQAAKLGQEATDKLHAHLKALNPGLGDELLIPLLASMSVRSTEPRHKLSQRVTLGVGDLAPVELGGYPQVAFRHGAEITLPVTIDTDRAIPRPTLRAQLKDARTLNTLATREWRFRRAEAGRLPTPAVIPASVTASLEPGREYLVNLALTWQGRNGRVGATTTQLIRIVGPMTFDTIDSGQAPVRLDDVDRDRAWWHRVWAGDFDADVRRVDAEVTYTYRLATGDTNVRRPGRANLDSNDDNRRLTGRVASGLDVALAELSRLSRRMTGDALSSEVLQALEDEQFATAFGRQARAQVRVRGRSGGQAAVWVWPEVKLHDVTFQVPGETSPITGQILSFEPHVATVPIPAIAHIVTTKSS